MRSLPDGCVGLSVYSPPFQSGQDGGGLYVYSSDPRDISNSLNGKEFWEHYDFVVKEIHRLTMPGRMSVVHCMDIPTGNTGKDSLLDFPGDIIRQHKRLGWEYVCRYHVWKEPLLIRNRTMIKALSHKALTLDSTKCSIAHADYLLIFRRSGENTVPVAHPQGLQEYAGERKMPGDILRYKNWPGSQLENKYSHWIWRRYADAFWDDIRIDRTLPYRAAKDEGTERHVHPLQLDVIERAVVMWSNPGETVLSPFAGVGSEIYGAVLNGRRGLGIELKRSFYVQAVKNLEDAASGAWKEVPKQADLFAEPSAAMDDTESP